MEMGIETAFTPWASLLGGVLIGLSAVMLMGLFGRIAGIAGITQGALGLPGAARDRDWRWAFMAGLVLAPLAVIGLGGTVAQSVPTNLGGMAVAGLLVGLGTALGSGCTSGHGVCGLARLSVRSLAAVVSFMAAGFVTVFVLRHVLGGL
ncbi:MULTISPECIES: YeeE/YedE family protein [unclassified Paracoccus (in: a-proteobacteria)]|uniref:YeeE/YedE family protein n=1 Tax=unclassified Paracoccus (in: a-proteobacteria) TaxID=2688777 RepID=UPI0018A6BF0F|nr:MULTISPECIES: YeeE/YedE family protein [unclassified Paracoccus (in: a-proteobacteria)]UXU74315.1 YeeE/YedE family protein [Paracoccus sp. SMMA_5]UXU80205.1 YeeE/YedE family protein [Paracoccus sp. SMMA_5_TC]